MKTIKGVVSNEITINRSRFITLLFRVQSEEEVQRLLLEARKDYKDATHYCYAYVVNNSKKSSDDGEPSGTAGTPILEVLNKWSLNFVFCIVVRYFGGVKLGAGGLIRAYVRSVQEALNKGEIVELIKGVQLSIEFNYDDTKKIDYMLRDYCIIKKVYNELVTYFVNVAANDVKKLEKRLQVLEGVKVKMIKKEYIDVEKAVKL